MDLSPGPLFASFAVSTVGLGLFLYGKKQTRFPQLGAGLLLMVFPYFVPSALGILGGGGLVVLALWGLTRAGM